MQGFRNWLEVDEFGMVAKRAQRIKTADAYPRDPIGQQPLDSIDTEKAQKMMVPLGLFMPMHHMSDDVPANKIKFDFAGDQDKSVIYWMERIQSGERPALLVSGLFAGKRGVVGLTVKDGNHRATAYYILRIPKIPVILTAGAKNFINQLMM